MQLPILNSPELSPKNSKTSEHIGGRKYSVVSLGCPKNLVDTEQMLGRLDSHGYCMTRSLNDADFVVVNTCGFIESARKESCNVIEEMIELKRRGDIRGLIVTGCLAERNRESLMKDYPEIDSLIGVFGRNEIAVEADRIFNGINEQRSVFRPAPIRALSDNTRSAVTPAHFAYLKISEGCDRLCTFCAIPKMRGKHASKPIEQIYEEAKLLADSGVRELVIVAQDTTYYGIDLYGEARLRELIEKLDSVQGIEWIRLMYLYPMFVDEPLLRTIKESSRVIPYLDMPLQHSSNEMLKRMARKVNKQQILELLTLIKQVIPDVVLRTTMITGFPGESEKDHRDLLEFINEVKFDHLGVFTYSPEENTPSSKLPNKTAPSTVKRRFNELMGAQRRIAFARSKSRIGTNIEVLVDSELTTQPGTWLARSYAEAPDIDGIVYISSQPDILLQSGKFVSCEVVASNGYDIIAAPVSNPW